MLEDRKRLRLNIIQQHSQTLQRLTRDSSLPDPTPVRPDDQRHSSQIRMLSSPFRHYVVNHGNFALRPGNERTHKLCGALYHALNITVIQFRDASPAKQRRAHLSQM